MQVIPIRLSMVQVFAVRDRGAILVDCGMPNQGKSLVQALQKTGVDPRSIGLIVLTHGHVDHIGSAVEVQSLTGAPVAMHRIDHQALEQGTMRVPGGTNRLSGAAIKLFSRLGPGASQVALPRVDVIVGDEGLSLDVFGIAGRIVFTPGHTNGSISVLLEDGDALVGDLAMNMFPMRVGPGLPGLAEDMQQIKSSLRRLAEAGAKTLYPAHGGPIPMERLRAVL